MLKLLLAVLLSLLTGCSDIAFYTQAVEGHLKLMAETRAIPEIINDSSTTPALREQLKQAMDIRSYASNELGLPDNGSYRSYADLGRPYVVWNVFAAPEFSVEPQQWCMIFVGCVNYRGYYEKTDADHYADELKKQELTFLSVEFPLIQLLDISMIRYLIPSCILANKKLPASSSMSLLIKLFSSKTTPLSTSLSLQQ